MICSNYTDILLMQEILQSRQPSLGEFLWSFSKQQWRYRCSSPCIEQRNQGNIQLNKKARCFRKAFFLLSLKHKALRLCSSSTENRSLVEFRYALDLMDAMRTCEIEQFLRDRNPQAPRHTSTRKWEKLKSSFHYDLLFTIRIIRKKHLITGLIQCEILLLLICFSHGFT